MNQPRHEIHIAELGATWFGILGGIAMAVLMAANAPAYERAAIATLAFAAVYSLPGFLALFARRGRPVLYLASGLIYLPLSITAMSGVTLPLVIPAVMAFVAYGRHADEAKTRAFSVVVAVTVVVLAVSGFFAMFLHEDPRCAVTETSSSCTSDVVTNTDGLISLTATMASLGLAWTGLRPRER